MNRLLVRTVYDPIFECLSVYKARSKNPLFIIRGISDLEDVNFDKVEDFAKNADWEDLNSAGWITPNYTPDGFLKGEAQGI